MTAKRDTVQETQTLLATLGYDLGTFGEKGDGVDGVRGKLTRAAEDKARHDLGLSKDADLLEALRQRAEVAALGKQAQAHMSFGDAIRGTGDLVGETWHRNTPQGGVHTVGQGIGGVVDTATDILKGVVGVETSGFGILLQKIGFTSVGAKMDHAGDALFREASGLPPRHAPHTPEKPIRGGRS
jgi:hypothetical protein